MCAPVTNLLMWLSVSLRLAPRLMSCNTRSMTLLISAVPLQFPGQSNQLVVPDVGSCVNLSLATVNECEVQELSTIDVMPPMGDCAYTCTYVHPLYM